MEKEFKVKINIIADLNIPAGQYEIDVKTDQAGLFKANPVYNIVTPFPVTSSNQKEMP